MTAAGIDKSKASRGSQDYKMLDRVIKIQTPRTIT